MSKTNTWENDFLAWRFQGAAIPAYVPAAGAADYIALFTADPGEAGTVTEVGYTGYARQPILRQSTGNGWGVSGTAPTQAVNLAEIVFPQSGGGSTPTATYFGVMSAATGGTMSYKGPLNTPLIINGGIIPRMPAGTLVVQED